MRKSHVFWVLLLIVFWGCKGKPDPTSSEGNATVENTETKPLSTFVDLDGQAVELSDFKGKKVLLNFWATWCRPCIEEMPALLRAQEQLTSENYVLLLASDQSLEKIKAFRAKKGFDFTFLKFNGQLSDMNVDALPATFIYNEAGNFRNRIDGATEWDSPKVLDKLKAIR